jgi:hypothetical protein
LPPPDDFGSQFYGETFYQVLTAAVIDLCERGYDSPERVAYWIEKLRGAAQRSMLSKADLSRHLAATLRALYREKVERGGILRRHAGIERFTLERISPRLRAELDRRILAAASLIRVNREEAVSTTLRRFAGWSTSIPPGGSDAVDRREVKSDIRKPLRSLPFKERRVAIDQGHKLVANISEILATDGGAIAGVWRSNWRQANYDYRPDHRERDGQFYMVRGNWALDRGLVKVGTEGYTDDITKPGEEVFCRCQYQWIHSIGRLPDAMLTERGRAELDAARGIAA